MSSCRFKYKSVIFGWLTFWDSEIAAAEGAEQVPLPDPSALSPGDRDAVGPADAHCVCSWDHCIVLLIPLCLPSLQIMGLRGESLRREVSTAVFASSYKSSAWGFQKLRHLWWCCWLRSFLLTLLLAVQAALIAWVLPWGSRGIQGARERGGMALPEQLERLLSVQRSTQPSIFI